MDGLSARVIRVRSSKMIIVIKVTHADNDMFYLVIHIQADYRKPESLENDIEENNNFSLTNQNLYHL